MTIPDETLSAIKSRVDMATLVSEHLPLKRSGANYSACCPFHEEKTPSFTVSDTKGFYHCFGCHAHGDQIDWMVNYLGMTWNEAVARLAEMAGVPLPENEDSDRVKAKTRVSQILTRAAAWMHLQLMSTELARSYVIDERKVSREIVELFVIGWAPKQVQPYLSAFNADEIEVLEQAGLLGKADGGRLYAKLGGRVVFPIRDAAGWVIGFSGRVMGEGLPKYMNSPDSPFFSKRNEIFRPPEVQRAARRAGRVLVTEGYFDVISLYTAGFPYTVAGMGTSTTPENMESMFALANELVFCLDGDKAGRQAAWKALLAALPFIGEAQRGSNRLVAFVFLPNGADPDEFIRVHGEAEFARLLDNATPLSGFFIESYRKKRAAEPMEKHSELLTLASKQIAMVKDDVLRSGLASGLANIFDVSVNQVRSAGGFASRRAAAQPGARLAVQADALEIGFLVNLLRRPTEVECLPVDVELKVPGGTEIVDLLRKTGPDISIFEGTPYWPLVERLLDSDEADDILSVNAKRIELAWVTRRIEDAIKVGDRDALRQLLARKFDVQTQIDRAFGAVMA